MEKLAKTLKIDQYEHKTKDDSEIYTLPDDNAFGSVYSVLESDDDFKDTEDNFLINSRFVNLTYVYKNKYTIELTGDLDKDVYSVIITEKQ